MSDTTPDLGAMVSKLLADPALLSQIASAVGVGGTPTPEMQEDITPSHAEARTPAAAKPDSAGAPSFNGSLGSLDSLGPILSLLGGTQSTPAGAGGGKPMQSNAARRVALLSSLKPFCNSHRCQTIDYMISISRLSDTLLSGKE